MAGPNQRIRAIRGFRHQGKTIGPGSILDLDKGVATELRTANKVVFVQSDTKLEAKSELPTPVLGRAKPDTKPKSDAK